MEPWVDLQKSEARRTVAAGRLPADVPGGGLDVFDGHPGDLTEAFTLHEQHGVRHLADHPLFLLKREVC